MDKLKQTSQFQAEVNKNQLAGKGQGAWSIAPKPTPQIFTGAAEEDLFNALRAIYIDANAGQPDALQRIKDRLNWLKTRTECRFEFQPKNHTEPIFEYDRKQLTVPDLIDFYVKTQNEYKSAR